MSGGWPSTSATSALPRNSLLATKLFVPVSRPNLVSRPRLLAQLDQGLTTHLTLVAAPAGFGKTTLLSEWLSERQYPAAWLSLDTGDNDLARFLAYLIAALQTICADAGQVARTLLQSPQPPPAESVLTILINEIATGWGDTSLLPGTRYALVLDDYHLISARPVHDAVTFLLDHLSPQMHLVILTRADPPLPLARLRARNQLAEIRADHLRFTPDEATAFLSQVMGLELSTEDTAALATRTEGWVAGLQLAALSMQSSEDVPSFVADFTGSHRYVVDYLVEEVLSRQPKAVQSFLLQTPIVDQMSGPLCNALTQRPFRSHPRSPTSEQERRPRC